MSTKHYCDMCEGEIKNYQPHAQPDPLMVYVSLNVAPKRFFQVKIWPVNFMLCRVCVMRVAREGEAHHEQRVREL